MSDLARPHAADADGNRIGSDVAAAGGEEVRVLRFADVDAASAAADDDAAARLGDAKAGILPRFARRDDAEQCRPRIPLRIGTAVVPIITLERRRIVDGDRRHPGGNLTGIGGDVELGDGFGAAAAPADVMPEALTANAEWRHHADAGDHDAGRCRGAHLVATL